MNNTTVLDPAIISVALAFLLSVGLSFIAKVLGEFSLADNQNPRAFLSQTTGAAARADAAHKNSFEIFPLYAAAIIMAMVLHIPHETINTVAIVFIVLRCCFCLCYVLNWHLVRSALWVLSALCPLYLLALCIISHAGS